jgi:hypothetical protein
MVTVFLSVYTETLALSKSPKSGESKIVSRFKTVVMVCSLRERERERESEYPSDV